jgi:prepilin-type N-terminal cleavage/methylation domain-containing protein
MQNLSSRRGFTLLEMMLAIAIAVAVMVLAIPNMRGTARERRLRETFERFDGLARKAQLNAVRQQRPWSISWEQNRIVLKPDDPKPEEVESGEAQEESLPITNEEGFTLERHAALLAPKDTPGVWTFWRSGTCEPVIVGYSGPEGTWSAQYDPLTGHGDLIEIAPR